MGTIFHLTARVHCPFPVSIASLEEHLESVVIVRTSLEKATATSPTTPALIPTQNNASSITSLSSLSSLMISVRRPKLGKGAWPGSADGSFVAVEYCVVAGSISSRGADVAVDSGGSGQWSW